MEAFIVEPKNQKEFDTLVDILSTTGIASLVISEVNKKYLAGLKMKEVADQHPKFDISEDEIINMLKEDEDEIYAQDN